MAKGEVFTTGIVLLSAGWPLLLCPEVNGTEVVIHNIVTSGKAQLEHRNSDGSIGSRGYTFPDAGGKLLGLRLHGRYDSGHYQIINTSGSSIFVFAEGMITAEGSTGAQKGDMFFRALATNPFTPELDIRPEVGREAVIHNLNFDRTQDLYYVDTIANRTLKLATYSEPADYATSVMYLTLHCTYDRFYRLTNTTSSTCGTLADGVYTK